MRSLRLYLVGSSVVVLLIVGVFSLIAALRPIDAASAQSPVPVAGQTTPAPANQPSIPAAASSVVLPNGQVAAVPAFKSDTDMTSNVQQIGSPAIKPSIVGAGPTSPAFTKEDVIQWANQHPNGFGKLTVLNGPASVVKVEFQTLGALRQKSSEPLNLEQTNDTLLCYVEYTGKFAVPAPVGLPSLHYTRIMQIFDAHTGNLLTQGAISK